MLIYIVLLLIIIIAYFLFKKNKKLYVILICLLLSVVSGFRDYSVGNDTAVYLRTHNAVAEKGLDVMDVSRMEPGYIMLDFVSSKFSKDFNSFLFIVALITNAGVAFLIIKFSKNPMISLLFFILFRFYFDEMNIMRQFLSMSIVFYGVEYAKEKKLFKYLAVIALATTFHYSALFAFPIYFLFKKKFNRKTMIVLLVVAAVSFIFLDNILRVVTSRIGLYGGYVDTYYDSNKFGNILGAILSTFIYAYSSTIYKKYGDESIDKKEYGFLLNVSFICMLLNICSIRISVLSRLIDYYSVFMIILLPNVNALIEKTKHRQFANLMLITLGAVYFISIAILRPNWNKVIPYKTFFQ